MARRCQCGQDQILTDAPSSLWLYLINCCALTIWEQVQRWLGLSRSSTKEGWDLGKVIVSWETDLRVTVSGETRAKTAESVQ